MKTFIIAEAGVNHNGSIKIAKKLIDKAVECGADAVKFQTFKAERIVAKFTPLADYQKGSIRKKSQYALLKELELSERDFISLYEYCKKRNIIFISSPFDVESAKILYKIGMNIFKIPSGEITNYPLLKEIGGYRKKVIISTGMAKLGEIEEALEVILKAGTKKENLTVLHCNTEYPTPFKDVNLYAMLTIREAFKINVGYSDHTMGIEVPIAAVALGANVIEKHFTLDKNMKGPDHKASLEPTEFKKMVESIRNIERALGDGIKKPSSSEIKNIFMVRKSIVAKRKIKKGEIFTEENITTKRAGKGISPMRWNEILGKVAIKDYEEDEVI